MPSSCQFCISCYTPSVCSSLYICFLLIFFPLLFVSLPVLCCETCLLFRPTLVDCPALLCSYCCYVFWIGMIQLTSMLLFLLLLPYFNCFCWFGYFFLSCFVIIITFSPCSVSFFRFNYWRLIPKRLTYFLLSFFSCCANLNCFLHTVFFPFTFFNNIFSPSSSINQ